MENEPENTIEQKPEEPDTEALQREIEAGKAGIAEMKNNLAAKETEIVALNKSLEETRAAAVSVSKSLAAAVGAYRELIVRGNPGVLADLVGGDTIEKVDASLQNARAIMARARQEVEAEAARVRVPAGAPQRAPQDLAALTAREKIQIGIRG
jgi:hypothetical protein